MYLYDFTHTSLNCWFRFGSKFWSSFEKRYCLVHFWKEIHDSWKCCTHVWSMFDVSRSAWWVQEYIIDQNNDVKTESRASCRKWTKASKAPPKVDGSEALGRLLACLRNHLVDTFQVRRHHCHHNISDHHHHYREKQKSTTTKDEDNERQRKWIDKDKKQQKTKATKGGESERQRQERTETTKDNQQQQRQRPTTDKDSQPQRQWKVTTYKKLIA